MNLNPWGLILAGLGIVLMYVGVKGSQHSLVSAILGHPSAGSSQQASFPASTPTPGHSAVVL